MGGPSVGPVSRSSPPSPSSALPGVEQDARGIVDPDRLQQVATLHRYPAGDGLADLVDWFWAVRWDVPPGQEHVQQVLTHPSANLSVGTVDAADRALLPAQGRVYGVHRRIDSRRLVGQGWTVAAKTTGGVGVLTGLPAHRLNDTELPLDDALGVPGASRRVAGAAGEQARVDALRTVLEDVLAGRDPGKVEQARLVHRVARSAEHDRSVVRVDQLADLAGVSPRTLHRLFSAHLGVSPAWVVRRWRIVEACGRAADGDAPDWAGLAAELGYADQAHLVRDFRAHLGTTPAAYTRRRTA